MAVVGRERKRQPRERPLRRRRLWGSAMGLAACCCCAAAAAMMMAGSASAQIENAADADAEATTYSPTSSTTAELTTADSTTSPSVSFVAPTFRPTTERPTPLVSPSPSLSSMPTASPTGSFSPSVAPSTLPSLMPSASVLPTSSPSASKQPSNPPSTPPSFSPVIAPSMVPTLTEGTSYSREYIQRLTVSVPESFDQSEMVIFQFVYERYSQEFGYMRHFANGGIVSKCTVNSQQIGINRRKRGFFDRDVRRGLRTTDASSAIDASSDAGELFLDRENGHWRHSEGSQTNAMTVDGIQDRSLEVESGEYDDGDERSLTGKQTDASVTSDSSYRILEGESGEYDGSSKGGYEQAGDVMERSMQNDFWDTPFEVETSRENIGRRLQSSPSTIPAGYPLTMRFTMTYSTRVGGYDISNYNALFSEYVNSNLDIVQEDLALLGLPVVQAGSLLMIKDKGPTYKPTSAPSLLPTLRPATPSPTLRPTASPTAYSSTSLPSYVPSERPPSLIESVDVTDNDFVLGLSLGLVGAFIISALALWHIRRKEKREAAEEKQAREERLRRATHMADPYGNTAVVAQRKDGSSNGGLGDVVGAEADSDSKSTAVELTPNDDKANDDGKDHSADRDQHQDATDMSQGDNASLSPKKQQQHDVEMGAGGRPPTLQPFGEGLALQPATSSGSPDGAASMGYVNMFTTLPYDDEYMAGTSPQRAPKPTAALPQSFSANNLQLLAQRDYSMHVPGGGAGGDQQNAVLIHDASFSSSDPADALRDEGDFIEDDDDLFDPARLDGSRDELDNYKNQDLETLRSAVEDAVDGVEGMMSLAVTRALTEDVGELDADNLPWGGAQDKGSVEASCLCETYDWVKRHDQENSGLDSVNEYFQDVLNRIIVTVILGKIPPLQGAQIIHACATILGLDLYEELPQTTLVITGMRKTNDLAQGHNFILKAFRHFGTVEEAAIAPNNRGFGFVRFAKPESVTRALKKYREYEIEIQDVSVSIKTIKPELPR